MIPTSVAGKSFNFISKDINPEDKNLFFGPLEDDEFIEIQEHWTLANILHACGIFKSVSQARKNGGNEAIQRGFSIMKRGKKQNKCNIFVLNL